MTATRLSLDCLPGKVVVEMEPYNHGALLIPGKVQRPTAIGVVVGSQSATRRQGKTITSPKEGTRVLVHKDDGLWIDDRDLSDRQIRVYGHFTATQGEPTACDWWHSVLGDMDTQEAYGDKVWIRHQAENVTRGGIFLPDSVAQRGVYGEVLGVGPLVDDAVIKGDVWAYDPRAVVAQVEDFVVVSQTGLLIKKP